MTDKLYLFLLITIASFFNNLIIPYIIYAQKFGLFKNRQKDFIGVNGWGIIMDGLLAACMNVVAINFLYEVSPVLKPTDLILSLFIAIVLTTASHILMAVRKWKIWIMPRPWHWNEAGYWHMFSMTVQFFFLAYPLIILLENYNLLFSKIVQFSLFLFISLFILFIFALYCYDNKIEFKLGKITIKSRPW